MVKGNSKFKYGCVAIIGKPNVGKSTLLNNLLSEKIAIVSKKAETTRHRISGIFTGKDMQVVFIDTPGIHKPFYILGEQLVRTAKASVQYADIILFLVNVISGLKEEDLRIIEFLRESKKPVILLINKIDLVSKSKALPIIDEISKLFEFKEIVPISAINKADIKRVLGVIKSYIPEGQKLYEDDVITDRSIEFLVSELIREKTLELTEEEVPHSIAVLIEEFKKREEQDLFYIKAMIYVERVSQRRIVIGHKGSLIKKIGQAARADVEDLIGKKVFLDIWVKVMDNWRRDPNAIKKFGYIE